MICPEISLHEHHSALRDVTKERRSALRHGGNLK
jgi:hypothetical protein